ncbi:MAG: hypothetical protein EOP85_16690 [Verrucomicrobiaceae bacterium]|nr:MAG: hypothetical protein EOP85_16690 [Verrucomicrobiaceae bacterium]
MKHSPVLALTLVAVLWVSLVSGLNAEKQPPSTSDFTSAYLKQLETVVGKLKVSDRGALDNDGSFFHTSISPTFELGLDPKSGRHTVFEDSKNGPIALFVFHSPAGLNRAFRGLDTLLVSGDLTSKFLQSYVCCANSDYFVLLVSEKKKIPMDSEAVLTLSRMLPRSGPSYWKMVEIAQPTGADAPAPPENKETK